MAHARKKVQVVPSTTLHVVPTTTLIVFPGDFGTKLKLCDGQNGRPHNRHYNLERARDMAGSWPKIYATGHLLIYKDAEGLWICDGQHRISFASDFASDAGFQMPMSFDAKVFTAEDLRILGLTVEDLVTAPTRGESYSRPTYNEVGQARSPLAKALKELSLPLRYTTGGKVKCLASNNVLAAIHIADTILAGGTITDRSSWTRVGDDIFFGIPADKARRYASHIAWWVNEVADPVKEGRGPNLFKPEALALAICLLETPENLEDPQPWKRIPENFRKYGEHSYIKPKVWDTILGLLNTINYNARNLLRVCGAAGTKR